MTGNADAPFAAFLARGAGQAFAWGRCDCALWACDWIKERRGIDPAEALRGLYGTAEDCEALLAREGGLRVLAARLFDAAGLRITGNLDLGDVGLVETCVGDALMLRTEGHWAWKAPRGILFLRTDAVMSWSV